MAEPSIVISDIQNPNSTAISVENFYYADSSFFEFFTFPLIYGNPKTVLQETGSVVISQSIANKIFGDQNPIGKSLTVDGKHNLTVTGVFKDIPRNTHLKFELLFSLNTLERYISGRNAWTNHSFFTYLRLKEGADPQKINAKLTSVFHSENRAIHQMNCVWELQPVNETYLKTSDFTSKPDCFEFGNNRIVYFLNLIAYLILGIAWLNYINLTTAKATERFKEIGIRKTNGANKKQLLLQFFSESVLLNIISIIVAGIIIAILFKWFASAINIPAFLNKNIGFRIIISAILLIGILFPCILSTFLLISHNTIKRPLYKGQSVCRISYRDMLVIFQFIIIIALLIGIGVVNRQLKYLYSIDLGFKKESVLTLNIPRIKFDSEQEKKLEIFRQELIKYSNIKDVTASVTIPGKRFGSGNSGPYISSQEDIDTYFRLGRVMPNFLTFYEIELLAGRDFNEIREANKGNIIINEAAVKEFGFQNVNDVLQKKVIWNEKEFTIIGVTTSFHQESLHIEPEPMIIYTDLFENTYNYISVKLNDKNIAASVNLVKGIYNSIFPGNPYNYFFLDSYFNRQYQKEFLFKKMFGFFSILALIIGYIGLYGLTTYRIIKRTKEVGVRKTNGAKIHEILAMLNKNFIIWIIIAFIIACPIAWYAMHKWLENFAYEIEISWQLFVLAGLLTLVIALLTVSWQSWRAASKNPVEALRYE